MIVFLVQKWGYSSAGRAPALQAGGQGFKSLYLHLDNYGNVSNRNYPNKESKKHFTRHNISKRIIVSVQVVISVTRNSS